jgi:hypothetical protein
VVEAATVELTDEIQSLLAEREQLYRRQAHATRDAERLHAIPVPDGESGRAGEPESGRAAGLARPVGPLTAEQTPPAELAAALAQLEPSLAEMERIERTIDEHRASVESLRHSATRMLTIAVAAVLLLLLLVVIIVGTR